MLSRKPHDPEAVSSQVNLRQRQFDALVHAHAADLYRFACWLCGDPSRAEDLVQETMLRAWRALDSLHDAAAAKPWLLTILRREHARGFERKRLDLTILDDGLKEAIADETTGADPEQAGSDAQLREIIMQLEPKYREPLLMQVLGGFSCAEIAEELGVKPGTVMTQLFRARHKLRNMLSGDAAAREATHGLP
ncbi:MAG TPA: sigma-70 family RNA polymerase sigma factor [Rhodanobacteraceae bacterium]|nr:sigma-70 family RNA polymerase sigma factor [Rhodanobacteraceae bacterium]